MVEIGDDVELDCGLEEVAGLLELVVEGSPEVVVVGVVVLVEVEVVVDGVVAVVSSSCVTNSK